MKSNTKIEVSDYQVIVEELLYEIFSSCEVSILELEPNSSRPFGLKRVTEVLGQIEGLCLAEIQSTGKLIRSIEKHQYFFDWRPKVERDAIYVIARFCVPGTLYIHLAIPGKSRGRTRISLGYCIQMNRWLG